MLKRIMSALLACALLCALIPWLPLEASAAVQSTYAPYAMIEYGYSSTVTCGTIRYVSQVTSDSYFYSAYWPSSAFGYYTGASVECGTASISMALSYIGVNKTANDILVANNGATSFTTGWGGSTYLSYSASSLSTATDKYINGNGKYSPPVIHIPGYSSLGHYVVVVGRSGSTYQILDPWQRTVTSMTVSGSSATYYRNGYATYDTIDQIHQWYNANASLEYVSTLESFPSHCTIKANESTPVNTQPCSVGSYESTTIETASAGDTYTAVALYRNSFGNLWYEVTSKSGKTGYMYGGHVSYVDQITSDICLNDATFPNGHVAGTMFIVDGAIQSSYNQLKNVALYVYQGFGIDGAQAVGYSDPVDTKSYPLHYSNLDAYTKFGSLTAGNYTYTLYATYENYYAADVTTLGKNSGTVTLAMNYFVVIPASVSQTGCSHTYTTTTVTAATCTQEGYEIKACSTCGLINEGVTSTSGHSFGEWTSISGTCTQPGSRSRSCIACGYTESETLTTGGHNYNSTYNAPTCTAPGGTTYICTRCGDTYTESVAASGHKYNQGVVVTPATCNTTGVRKYTCTLCGESYQKSIYATGHTYNSGIVTAPTCTAGGYTTYTCMDCGSSYTDNPVAATGHVYTSQYTAPTCTSSGGTRHICIDCGHSYMDGIVSATGHKYNAIVTAPTCNTAGYTKYICTVCGDSYTGNNTSATGHRYSSGYCINCGGKDPSFVQVIKPTLTLSYPTLAFRDQIQYNIYFNATNTDNVVEMGLLTFASRLENGTVADALEIIPGYTASGSSYFTTSNGIPAKNLADTLYFKVYAKLSDGSYAYSSIAGYHAVAYAKTVLNSSSTSVAAKQLMIAMLNYGAAAQINFGYNTDNLMNSFLSAAAQSKISAYDESMVAPVVTADIARAGHFVMNKTAFTSVYPSVSFEGSFSINYYFVTGLTPDNGLTFCYWDAETYENADKLTTANATGMMKMTKVGDRWHACVEGIAAKDMDKTIYIAAIYKSGGVGYTTNVIAYSLGRYCETIAAKGNDFGAATAVYGYYAKAYFAS